MGDESEQITSVTQVKLLKRGKEGMEDIPNVPLKKGDIALALFPEDKKFYRAKIEKVDGDGTAGKVTIKWDDPDGFEPVQALPRDHIKLVKRQFPASGQVTPGMWTSAFDADAAAVAQRG